MLEQQSKNEIGADFQPYGVDVFAEYSKQCRYCKNKVKFNSNGDYTVSYRSMNMYMNRGIGNGIHTTP